MRHCWPSQSSSCHKRDSSSILQRTAIWLLVLLALTSQILAAQTPPAPPPFVERPEAELLLLAVKVKQFVVSDTFPAYAVEGGRTIVPLGELSLLLSLAIEVDVANGTADGFIINETRRFHLDVKAGRVIITGKEMAFDRERVEVHQDDIYVDTALLSSWLPIQITIDLFAAVLRIEPREPLPFQLRHEREQRIQRTLAALGYSGQRFPLMKTPYLLWDGPFLDQSFRLVRTSGDESAGSKTRFEYSTFASADLLYMQGDLYLSGSNEEPASDTRLTLSRRDPEPILLGELKAREVAIGEIFSPGDQLLLNASSGPGALLSSYPLLQQNQFDRHTFRGNLPPGWEIELYHNESLIAYQQSRADGLYQFDDIPLHFGLNIFRLVSYGPQGQISEEILRFNIGETLAPPGELYYRLAANDSRLFDKRALAELDYGLHKQLSINTGVAWAELPDRDHSYAKAGLSGFWRTIFAKGDVAFDDEGGSLVRAAVQSRLGFLSLFLQQVWLSDFSSEVFNLSLGELSEETKLRIDGITPRGLLPPLPLSLEMRRQKLAAGGTAYHVSNRVSGVFRRTFLSNHLAATFGKGVPGLSESQVQGSFLGNRSLRNFGVRGEISYFLRPNRQINTIALTAETYRVLNYLLQAGINRTLSSRQTTYLVNANRTEGRFAYGINMAYSDPGGFTFSANLFAGLNFDPRNSRWYSRSRSAASLGAASAFVFLDRNGNGKWDRGEKPIEGAGFFVDRASHPTTTDKQGIAFLSGLVGLQPREISISPSTLEDSLWMPQQKGVRIIPRPGKPTRIDFPVIIGGEITGTVYVRRNDGTSRPASGIELEIVDGKGGVIKQARTAYDGFYEILGVPPGRYVLRLSEKSIARSRLLPTVKEIAFSPDGTVLDGVDLVLEQQSR